MTERTTNGGLGGAWCAHCYVFTKSDAAGRLESHMLRGYACPGSHHTGFGTVPTDMPPGDRPAPPWTSAVAPSARDRIFADIDDERARQDAKWGEMNHPLVGNPHAPLQKVHGPTARFIPGSAALIECHRLGIPSESEAREACEAEHAAGDGTFASIVVEELAEAVSAAVIHGETSDEARKELVQTTAVLVAMIEAIDRKRAPSAVVP